MRPLMRVRKITYREQSREVVDQVSMPVRHAPRRQDQDPLLVLPGGGGGATAIGRRRSGRTGCLVVGLGCALLRERLV